MKRMLLLNLPLIVLRSCTTTVAQTHVHLPVCKYVNSHQVSCFAWNINLNKKERSKENIADNCYYCRKIFTQSQI